MAGVLLDAEQRLWVQLSGPDRRHAVGVARRVERSLGNEARRHVVAAALLHDVGKLDARLGTFARVAATLVIAALGRELVLDWQRTGGWRRRVALYARHPELGADRLAVAGSHGVTVAWAREHHLPRDRWTVAWHLGDALAAADDD